MGGMVEWGEEWPAWPHRGKNDLHGHTGETCMATRGPSMACMATQAWRRKKLRTKRDPKGPLGPPWGFQGAPKGSQSPLGAPRGPLGPPGGPWAPLGPPGPHPPARGPLGTPGHPAGGCL